MAKQPATTQRARDYHVYNTALNEVGRHPVVSREDARVVVMTRTQAQYWLDQGIIGEKPLADLSSDHLDHLNQISGGRIDAKIDEPAKSDEALAKPVEAPLAFRG